MQKLKYISMSYTAIIEPCEEGGYFAQCAEIENAFTQGETVKEVMDNLEEVIALVEYSKTFW